MAPPTKTRGIDILAGYAAAVAHVPVPPAYMTEHPEQANARLIAAAPELLAVLIEAMDSRAPDLADAQHDGWSDRARKAIAKATGQ